MKTNLQSSSPIQPSSPVATIANNCHRANQRITVIETKNEHNEKVLIAVKTFKTTTEADCHPSSLTVHGIRRGSCLEKFMARMPWRSRVQAAKVMPLK